MAGRSLWNHWRGSGNDQFTFFKIRDNYKTYVTRRYQYISVLFYPIDIKHCDPIQRVEMRNYFNFNSINPFFISFQPEKSA